MMFGCRFGRRRATQAMVGSIRALSRPAVKGIYSTALSCSEIISANFQPHALIVEGKARQGKAKQGKTAPAPTLVTR